MCLRHRNSHYCQSAPRFKPHTWLVNLCNPATSPNTEGRKTVIKEWKEKKGQGETLTLQCHLVQEHMESWCMSISKCS